MKIKIFTALLLALIFLPAAVKMSRSIINRLPIGMRRW